MFTDGRHYADGQFRESAGNISSDNGDLIGGYGVRRKFQLKFRRWRWRWLNWDGHYSYFRRFLSADSSGLANWHWFVGCGHARQLLNLDFADRDEQLRYRLCLPNGAGHGTH